jgi:hypothetical protein
MAPGARRPGSGEACGADPVLVQHRAPRLTYLPWYARANAEADCRLIAGAPTRIAAVPGSRHAENHLASHVARAMLATRA